MYEYKSSCQEEESGLESTATMLHCKVANFMANKPVYL